MAVTSITELSPSGSVDPKGRKYIRRFQVLTDALTDGPKVALFAGVGATQIPEIGDPYEFNPPGASGTEFDDGAFALSKSCSEAERIDNNGSDGYRYEVTVTYGVDESDGDSSIHPLTRPQEEEWGSVQYQKSIAEAIKITNGNPDGLSAIVASNGEPFDEAITVDDSRIVLTITKNLGTFPSSVLENVDTVNSDAWKGAPPRCAKFNGVKSRQVIENYNGQPISFWATTYEFQFRVDPPDYIGWDIEILNHGTYYFKTVGVGPPQKIKASDAKGQSLNTVLLDANGELTTSDSPTYSRYRYYREIPFGNLGLGS